MRQFPSSLLLLSLLFAAQPVLAEWNGYSGHYFFLSQLPSPRAQGLGKITSTLRGDPFSCAIQPAGLVALDNVGLAYSSAPSLGWKGVEGSFMKYGAAWVPARYQDKKEKYAGVLAASYGRADYGEIAVTDESGQLLASYSSYTDLGTISVGHPLNSQTSVGASLIYLNEHDSFFGQGYESSEWDSKWIGAAVSAQQTGKIETQFGEGTLLLGVSLANLNPLSIDPKAILDWSKEEKPIILRTGPGLELTLTDLPIRIGLYGEYQVLINSVERSAVRWASEVWCWNIVAIRYGRYSENLRPSPSLHKEIQESTFGATLNLPFQQFWPDFHIRAQLDLWRGYPESRFPGNRDYMKEYTHIAFTLLSTT